MKAFGVALFLCGSLFASSSSTNFIINPPTFSESLEKKASFEIGGCFFSSKVEGLSFAIKNHVYVPTISPTIKEVDQLNHLTCSQFENLKCHREVGLKLGLSYLNFLSRWELGGNLTYFNPGYRTVENLYIEDTTSFIPLLASFTSSLGGVTSAKHIEVLSDSNFFIFDAFIRNDLWYGKRMSLQPHLGLRYAKVGNHFSTSFKGGSWSSRLNPSQDSSFSEVTFDRAFFGVGPSAGLKGSFHLGCGFEAFADEKASLVYGHFSTSQKETVFPEGFRNEKTVIVDCRNRVYASRPMFDVTLGLCHRFKTNQNTREFEIKLAWQHILFFNYQQCFSISRLGSSQSDKKENLSGANNFHQTKGNFSAEGVVLNFSFKY